MQKKSGGKVTIQEIIDLLDRLSPDEEPELLGELQSWFLKRGLEKDAESCVILYKYSADRITSAEKITLSDLNAKEEVPQSREHLEKTYQELQNQVIEIRQAIAEGIASEKELVKHIEKYSETIETWKAREKEAISKSHDDWAKIAHDRQAECADAAKQLQSQLTIQRTETTKIRNNLIHMEMLVKEAYARKQIFIARERAASASLQFKAKMDNFNLVCGSSQDNKNQIEE